MAGCESKTPCGGTACLMLAVAVVLFSGCGGVKTYLHDRDDTQTQLAAVTLHVGEGKQAIRQTVGIMSIGGGYAWGLVAADPSVVKIEYVDEGQTTNVYLTGLREGATSLYYVNRAVFGDPARSIGDYGDEGEYHRAQSRHFDVVVRGVAGG